MAIPNTVHFIYGLTTQTYDFLFTYYLAVLSAKVVNKPDKIYLHYHYEPSGKWWEETKSLVELKKIDPPENWGSKKIKRIAHKADKARLLVLKEYGGAYFDIDTICASPYEKLLSYDFVIGEESQGLLCNAVMFSKPNADFVNAWIDLAEEGFNPDGWNEVACRMPHAVASSEPFSSNESLFVAPTSFFLQPSWSNCEDIFYGEKHIPEDLITLHLWETAQGSRGGSGSLPIGGDHKSAAGIQKEVENFDWCHKNPHTMYGKMMMNVLEKM